MGQPFFSNTGFLGKLKVLILSLLILILLIVSGLGIYLGWGYYQIASSFSAREKQTVQANVDAGNIFEVGYVCDSKNVTCIKNRTKRLYWWVKIPNTKKRYLCEWQYGFSAFKKGEAVIFFHKDDSTEWPEDLTGYLIGRQGQLKDNPSCVALLGVDEIDS